MRFKIVYDDDLDCSTVRKKFSEYLDGMLSEEQRVNIHNHLKFCEHCSEELDTLCRAVSVLMETREECLPASIQDFRLPRSTFVEIFPTIREEPPRQTISSLFPYVYALIVFFLVVCSWEFAYRHTFEKFYNASNYMEVVAKI